MSTLQKKIFQIIIGISFLFQTVLYADKTVMETATINHSSYPNKNIEELKSLVLKKAKLQAAYKIYGEVLLSRTSFENGKINGEYINNIAGGIVHIKGEPKFDNGKNLGDIQVTIKAYATDADMKRYYKNTVNNQNNKQIHDIRPKRIKQKGFYGQWSGYLMENSGRSTKATIVISDNGQSKISFSSFECGGDLLIKRKDTHYTEFKKLLNYGFDNCEDKTQIILIKKSENQIQYTEYSNQKEQIAHGNLYRERE